eukprot:2533110-Pyramimonas_sp.AAC.1
MQELPAAHRARHARGALTATAQHLLEAGWDPQQATSRGPPASHPAAGGMWKSDDDMHTGLAALDLYQGAMADFKQTPRHALWQRDSQHFYSTG